MDNYAGMKKAPLQALPQIQSRLTFLYLEHCTLNRDEGAITVCDDTGIVFLPAATINVILLGPGTSITHRAMELISDSGVSVIWVGEHGVRYYASGRPVTRKSSLLLKQAELVSNQRLHLSVVRKMYGMRFPNEDVSALTMQQLRGREGARVRQLYRDNAKKYGVEWNGRNYDPNNYENSDLVNRALSSGNVCLYGLAASVISALGCSNGLGFVHVGHELSFAYDIADLYKAEVTIPLAFELAAAETTNIGSVMRQKTRDMFIQKHILERMIRDIHVLLSMDDDVDQIVDSVYLWDNREGTVKNGISYSIPGVTYKMWDDSNDSDNVNGMSDKT